MLAGRVRTDGRTCVAPVTGIFFFHSSFPQTGFNSDNNNARLSFFFFFFYSLRKTNETYECVVSRRENRNKEPFPEPSPRRRIVAGMRFDLLARIGTYPPAPANAVSPESGLDRAPPSAAAAVPSAPTGVFFSIDPTANEITLRFVSRARVSCNDARGMRSTMVVV